MNEKKGIILHVGAFAALTLFLTVLGAHAFHLDSVKIRRKYTEGESSTLAARQTVQARAPRTTGAFELTNDEAL